MIGNIFSVVTVRQTAKIKIKGLVLLGCVWFHPEDGVKMLKGIGEKVYWWSNVTQVGAKYWRQRYVDIIGNIRVSIGLRRLGFSSMFFLFNFLVYFLFQ